MCQDGVSSPLDLAEEDRRLIRDADTNEAPREVLMRSQCVLWWKVRAHIAASLPRVPVPRIGYDNAQGDLLDGGKEETNATPLSNALQAIKEPSRKLKLPTGSNGPKKVC